MGTITKLMYSFLFFGIFTTISMEMPSEEYCDGADADSLVQWYSQLYNFMQTNQNVSQQILGLYTTLTNLELKTQENHQKLDSILKGHQQVRQDPQIAQLLEKMKQLEEMLQRVQEKTNGDIVIQRRKDGSVDFYRPWNDYKQGFGSTSGEFFIGLEKLHKLTNSRPYELLVVMEDWANDRRYARYDQFIVGSEAEKYTLKSLGTYSGSAGDSLTPQLGQKFSTKDLDQDSSGSEHCAVLYKGAWWYNSCHESNLNGRYLKGQHTEYAVGVNWFKFKGHHYSLKFVEMLLRPK